MDTPNAFIGKTAPPTQNEIDAALGATADVWNQLLHWFAEQGVADQEWKSSSPKYGWSLRLKLKKRTIVYLAPCEGCFRVAFVLGDRAVAAARQSDLSKTTLKLLDEARATRREPASGSSSRQQKTSLRSVSSLRSSWRTDCLLSHGKQTGVAARERTLRFPAKASPAEA